MSAGSYIYAHHNHLGADVSGLYTTDSSSIFLACQAMNVYATRGVSLLAYTWTLQQANNSNTSWITVDSGSIGSSGSTFFSRIRFIPDNSLRPRWRWYRSSGNGAATMHMRAYGGPANVKGDRILWSNNAISAVGGSAPADNWKGNSGWSITWARRINLSNE